MSVIDADGHAAAYVQGLRAGEAVRDFGSEERLALHARIDRLERLLRVMRGAFARYDLRRQWIDAALADEPETDAEREMEADQ